MMNKVTIDYNKLTRALAERGKTKKWLSLELGRYESYIASIKNKPEQPESVERIICMVLEMEPGSLVADQSPKASEDASILQNIHREIKAERALLEEAAENLERIWNKLNANTIQLERIKDCVKGFDKTGADKAKEFLKCALADGKVNSEEVLLRSDGAGIKRADLMKAKNELGVDSATTGYGKNQKTWWFIPN